MTTSNEAHFPDETTDSQEAGPSHEPSSRRWLDIVDVLPTVDHRTLQELHARLIDYQRALLSLTRPTTGGRLVVLGSCAAALSERYLPVANALGAVDLQVLAAARRATGQKGAVASYKFSRDLDPLLWAAMSQGISAISPSPSDFRPPESRFKSGDIVSEQQLEVLAASVSALELRLEEWEPDTAGARRRECKESPLGEYGRHLVQWRPLVRSLESAGILGLNSRVQNKMVAPQLPVPVHARRAEPPWFRLEEAWEAARRLAKNPEALDSLQIPPRLIRSLKTPNWVPAPGSAQSSSGDS